MTTLSLSDVLSDWLFREYGETFECVEGADRVCDVVTINRLTEPPELELGDEEEFIGFATAEPWDALCDILEQSNLDVPAEDLLADFTHTLEAYR